MGLEYLALCRDGGNKLSGNVPHIGFIRNIVVQESDSYGPRRSTSPREF